MTYESKKRELFKDIYTIIDRLDANGIADNERINFCLLIHAACKRPQVLVGKHSFELMAAYLCGYDSALDRKLSNRRSWGLSEFGFWLGRRLNHSTSLHWTQMMMKSFPDETDAFAQLPHLYEEFLFHQAKTM